MPLQDIASTAAVADFVPDVEGGALLEAVLELSWVPTGVAGQS